MRPRTHRSAYAMGGLAAAALVVATMFAPAAGASPSFLPPLVPLSPAPAPPLVPPTDAPAPPLLVGASGPAAPVAVQGRAGQELVGTFQVDAGSCSGTGVAGSSFRMVQPGGAFMGNSSSPCSDNTWTPLKPGKDGGLRTGQYQAAPASGLADRILAPTPFMGANFAVSTNETDPQTQAKVPAPVLSQDGGRLSGDIRAFAVVWNGTQFNQGAPKPDGSAPGDTTGPSGTYDASNGRYVLEWKSQIKGGPFNNFTGIWRLEGTFTSSAGTTPATAAPTTAAGPQAAGTGSAAVPTASGATAGRSAGTSGSSWTGLPATGGSDALAGLVVTASGLLLARTKRAAGALAVGR